MLTVCQRKCFSLLHPAVPLGSHTAALASFQSGRSVLALFANCLDRRRAGGSSEHRMKGQPGPPLLIGRQIVASMRQQLAGCHTVSSMVASDQCQGGSGRGWTPAMKARKQAERRRRESARSGGEQEPASGWGARHALWPWVGSCGR